MACIAVMLEGPKAKNGRKVFDSFIQENKLSFWNQELMQAIESLIYMGFMRPGTLFISGQIEMLQVLKDAWARRLLKPAMGYSIASLGDLGAIQQVEQMHFVPLADVICDAVAQLNRAGQPATENTIRQYVARHCAHVAPPGIEMIDQTISSLLATGLVYKMREHIFVSIPTNTPPKPKATVECQTGTSILAPPQAVKAKRKGGIFSRLFNRGVRPTTTTQQQQQQQPIVFNPGQCLASLAAPPPPPQLPPPDVLPPRYATYQCDSYKDVILPPPPPINKTATNERRNRRKAKREARFLQSSSSECLNYGPIDPPEMLPGRVELVDEIQSKKVDNKRRRESPIARTSTPIESDSAFSQSPLTSSDDIHSDPEINHTYINLARLQSNNDSTQFEDLTCMTDEPHLLTHQMRGVLISNL